MLGCIGEFPTVAVGGVLRFLGFIFMSMAKTPVTPLDIFWVTVAPTGMTTASPWKRVHQPTIKMVEPTLLQ